MNLGDEFDDGLVPKVNKLYVEAIGSFVYDVHRRKGKGKTHRVHTDVVEYAFDEFPLRASFAYCTCVKGRKSRDRVCLCEHVLAVYFTIAGLTEEDTDDGEGYSPDDSGGGPGAHLGRPGEGLRKPRE